MNSETIDSAAAGTLDNGETTRDTSTRNTGRRRINTLSWILAVGIVGAGVLFGGPIFRNLTGADRNQYSAVYLDDPAQARPAIGNGETVSIHIENHHQATRDYPWELRVNDEVVEQGSVTIAPGGTAKVTTRTEDAAKDDVVSFHLVDENQELQWKSAGDR